MKYFLLTLCLISSYSFALTDIEIKNNRYLYCEGISITSKNIMEFRQSNIKERELLKNLSRNDKYGKNKVIKDIITLAYETTVGRNEEKANEAIQVFRKRIFVDCVLTDKYLIK